MYDPALPDPKLGLQLDVSFADYRKINAISTSEIKKFDSTLLHWITALGQPEKESEALKIGSGVDLLVQSQEAFDREMAVLGYDVNLRTKDGRALRDSLQQQFGLNGVLKSSEYYRVKRAAAALNCDPDFQKYADHVEWWQPTLVYTCPETGLFRKARPDLYVIINDERILVDVKTIQSGNAQGYSLQKQMYDYKYHWQAFSYLEACRHCGIRVDRFVFAFVDSNDPFDTAIKEDIEPIALEVAAMELDEKLRKIAYALNTGDFRGYDRGGTVSIPKWVIEKFQEKRFSLPENKKKPLSKEAQEIMDRVK